MLLAIGDLTEPTLLPLVGVLLAESLIMVLAFGLCRLLSLFCAFRIKAQTMTRD